jgi:hypothetical protein
VRLLASIDHVPMGHTRQNVYVVVSTVCVSVNSPGRQLRSRSSCGGDAESVAAANPATAASGSVAEKETDSDWPGAFPGTRASKVKRPRTAETSRDEAKVPVTEHVDCESVTTCVPAIEHEREH